MNPWLKGAILDETKHFVFSALAGLGAYVLIWSITRSACYSRGYRSRGRTWLDTLVDRCTSLWPWLAGFSAAYAAHWLQDGLL